MKALVSGGGGFIGSHVAEHFSEDYEVIVVDNLSRDKILGKSIGRKTYNIEYLKNFKNIKFFDCDIRDFDKLKEIGKDIDVIIHTAAQVAVTTSLKDPRLDFEINALGTLNMLEIARINDASFIFCSTNKVYGENVNKIIYSNSMIDCIKDSDCAMLITEWDEFKKLEPEDILKNMRNPLLIDSRRIYNPKIFSTKMKYRAIGLGR